MSKVLEMFAEGIQRILDREPDCANDIVSLTIAGETTRRVVALSVPDTVPTALTAYDAFLQAYDGPVPDCLVEALAEVLVDLDAYAHTPMVSADYMHLLCGPFRDTENGENLLTELNDVLATAVGLVRMGRRDRAWLSALTTKTTAVVGYLMPKLIDLFQFAEDHELCYGSDPDFPELYSFWDVLAYYAPSRIRLRATAVAWARRERLLGQAQKQHQERTKKRESR